jgi:hypothetical protein
MGMIGHGKVGRKWLAARIEAIESRQLLSSLSLVAPPDASAVSFTGPDRSTLIYYESNEEYQLSARAPDGTLTRLPITADTDSFTYSRGSVFFTTRDGYSDPAARSVARSDGTIAGTRYVPVESFSGVIRQIFALDNQLFIDGYDYSSDRLLYAHDAKLDRFRPINVDALARAIGASNVMPVAAGMIGGKRLFFIEKTRSLYELVFPKTGPLSFKEIVQLPDSTGDSSGTIGWTFLGERFYYTTGTRVGTSGARATTTWRSDGTLAGTVKLSGGVLNLDPTVENAVSIGSTHYAMDRNKLVSFDRSSNVLTTIATIDDVEYAHLSAAGDRLFYVVENQLYTIKPQDGPTTRLITLPGAERLQHPADESPMISGRRYITRVVSNDSTHRLMITEGKSATERRIALPPSSFDGSQALFDIKGVAGNGDVLIITTSNQGSGYYRIRIGSGDHAPTAVISGKHSFAEGGGLRLDASGSADADGDALSYAWDLDNDGEFDDFTTTSAVSSVSWGLLRKLNHRDGPDTFRIRVQVSDLEHATVSGEAIVRMKDTPPAVSVTQQKQVRVQVPTELALAFTDAGRDVVSSATINWGDGQSESVAVTNGAATASHSYAAAGKFNITVASTDEDGTRQSYSGTIDVVHQFSGPMLIGTVSEEFWLDYNSFALKDGTFLMERARSSDVSDVVARSSDGSPDRVLIKNRFLTDWQVLGKGALLVVSPYDSGFSYEYYWTGAGGKRTTKIAEVNSSDLPAIAAEGAYFIGDNSRPKLLDLDSFSISTARTAKREYPTAESEIVAWRNKAYFLGTTPKANGRLSLWRLDGATAVQIRSLPEITSSPEISVAGDRLMINGAYYSLSATKGRELLSDGTAAGTRVIKAAESSGNETTYEEFEDFDLTRFYSVRNKSKNELWSLDVKSATARKIHTFLRVDDRDLEMISQAGRYVYFSADDGHGDQLWRTDGTTGGTIALGVTMRDDFSDTFEAIGNSIYFAGRPTGKNKPDGVWVSDGTPQGTRLVDAGSTDLSSASALVSVPGRLAFTTIRSDVLEVWTVKAGTSRAERAFTIDSRPLAGGHFTSANAMKAGENWYVTAHVRLGSKSRDYLWAVYP